MRRKLRIPVISRLTIAWSVTLCFIAAFAITIAHPGLSGRRAPKMMLALGEIETLAPPIIGGLKLASPSIVRPPRLRDAVSYGPNGLKRARGPRILDIPPIEPEADINPDDVVITIASVTPKYQNEGVSGLNNASLEADNFFVREPVAALLKTNRYGDAPTISADGRRPVDVYRAPAVGAGRAATVSLIIGGLGIDPDLTARAIEDLPPGVSLAFAPYGEDLGAWARKARAAGHEVLLELPMEAHGGDLRALGPAALATGRAPAQNLQRLEWLLSRFPGYFAVTNYLGGKLSTDPEAMRPILERLADAGVGYLDDTGAARSLAAASGVDAASVDKLIAPPRGPDDARRFNQALRSLEKIARKEGRALGKTYANAATIDAVAAWTRRLENNDVAINPASSRLPRF